MKAEHEFTTYQAYEAYLRDYIAIHWLLQNADSEKAESNTAQMSLDALKAADVFLSMKRNHKL